MSEDVPALPKTTEVTMPITPSIAKSRRRMDAALHRDLNPDMHVRHFCVFGKDASLYYAEGLCSIDFLQHYVLTPLTALRDEAAPADLDAAVRQAVYNASVQSAATIDEAHVVQLIVFIHLKHDCSRTSTFRRISIHKTTSLINIFKGNQSMSVS